MPTPKKRHWQVPGEEEAQGATQKIPLTHLLEAAKPEADVLQRAQRAPWARPEGPSSSASEIDWQRLQVPPFRFLSATRLLGAAW